MTGRMRRMRLRRDDRDDRDDMDGMNEKRYRERDREGGKFDVAELVNDLAQDDDMGPNWWRVPLIDQAYMLRLRDMTFRQIGEWLHIDTETARRYMRKVEREMAPLHKEVRERVLGRALGR